MNSTFVDDHLCLKVLSITPARYLLRRTDVGCCEKAPYLGRSQDEIRNHDFASMCFRGALAVGF